jgi:hypothetical protein
MASVMDIWVKMMKTGSEMPWVPGTVWILG